MARKGRSLSPGALTARRFLRNRLAAVGLGILLFMFLFSFLGGALSPYGEDQVFYRRELQRKTVAGVTENTQYRFLSPPEEGISPVLQARFSLALGKEAEFTHDGSDYTVTRLGRDFYGLYRQDSLLCFACKDILTPAGDFAFTFAALQAWCGGGTGFFYEGKTYTFREDGTVILGQEPVGRISRRIFSAQAEQALSDSFRSAAEKAIEEGEGEFTFDEEHYTLSYDPATRIWSVLKDTQTLVWDSYASPSRTHLLGTDKNGMDVLTRLMYGGRVSLVIGFVVVLICAVLGVLVGGVCGYFGGWADQLAMRLVDIFYCIPTTPLLIILGAAMDGMRVDPQVRVLLLMLVLGLLGWPSVARLVRGQILSLREQEFMTAAEATGLRTGRRIFRHLIPNVIPQLIVTCTMSLGSTILTEATLSFLGLGVKFPFASWGNIMNDVTNAHVLTSYWFVWIPAGICLMLTVLGFNFTGDGLRDAFDPKMKR